MSCNLATCITSGLDAPGHGPGSDVCECPGDFGSHRDAAGPFGEPILHLVVYG